MKLSASQKKVLLFLEKHPGASAYDLKGTVARPRQTLNALQNLGLVKSKAEPGSFWSPETGIEWFLTEKGKRILTEINED